MSARITVLPVTTSYVSIPYNYQKRTIHSLTGYQAVVLVLPMKGVSNYLLKSPILLKASSASPTPSLPSSSVQSILPSSPSYPLLLSLHNLTSSGTIGTQPLRPSKKSLPGRVKSLSTTRTHQSLLLVASFNPPHSTIALHDLTSTPGKQSVCSHLKSLPATSYMLTLIQYLPCLLPSLNRIPNTESK
jgi:hypothetical protein